MYWFPFWVSTVVSLVVSLLLYRGNKSRIKLEVKFQAMELLCKHFRQKQESLIKQFNELRSGSMGMSQKLAELSERFDNLIEKQNELEMCDPEGRLYSRANKMVELGADIYELMEECDLPKAEAELLLSIKKQRIVR
ncbi:ATPase involved in DNA repair [Candidatus Enterovibrio escicola]|uniref:ATPase involved in DNA repair n=1 Tax=Candidatus Enterovibrio escicola TaxID=1927127 RepID=A0A2A5T1J4_9GAMM|nr:ATPase involved in DNA repair [Candidatus Enterovibrio escacola]